MTLLFTPRDIKQVDPSYFRKCREDIIAFVRDEHPAFFEELEDTEILRRVEFCIENAVLLDFVNLGSLRYLTVLGFIFSPAIFTNRKVQNYLRENRNGDIGLREMLYDIPPQNWCLLRENRSQKDWDRAIRNFKKRMAKPRS